VDRHARRDDAARRVDVHIDVLLRIFRFEEQKLRDDQRRHIVLNLARHEDDPFAQQAREDVKAAFAAARLFDDDGNKGGERVDHGNFVLQYPGCPPRTGGLPLGALHRRVA
jgi:hypothetical protein